MTYNFSPFHIQKVSLTNFKFGVFKTSQGVETFNEQQVFTSPLGVNSDWKLEYEVNVSNQDEPAISCRIESVSKDSIITEATLEISEESKLFKGSITKENLKNLYNVKNAFDNNATSISINGDTIGLVDNKNDGSGRFIDKDTIPSAESAYSNKSITTLAASEPTPTPTPPTPEPPAPEPAPNLLHLNQLQPLLLLHLN